MAVALVLMASRHDDACVGEQKNQKKKKKEDAVMLEFHLQSYRRECSQLRFGLKFKKF